MPNLLPLPIDSHLAAIKKKIDDSSTFFLKASPGCGKTTRLPPYLCLSTNKKVIVLEPRRISARQAAKRIAEEQGWEHGGRVGHLFRFENMTSEKTQLCFFTEGTFLRWWQNNPDLKDVEYILLDEFHERHLDTDLALALLLDFQKKIKPDLKIIIMSATLNLDELLTVVPNATYHDVEIPLYPVELKYFPHRPEFANMTLEKKVAEALESILAQKEIPGDILIFLAGMRDILKVQDYLLRIYNNHFTIQILHGDLTIEEQIKIFSPGQNTRKIILSTNIAESSVTIPSVRIVIDNGEHREAEVSPWSGLKTLKTKKISKASAIQRAGRAQRSGPGICFRLMSEFDYKTLADSAKPEILREDLTLALLWAKGLKLEPQWVTKPSSAQIEQSQKILFLIGCFDKAQNITELGKKVLTLPLHPRAARILLESTSASDLVQKELIKILATWLEGEQSKRLESRLSKILNDQRNPTKDNKKTVEECFLSGLFDQVVKKKGESEFIHQSGQVLKTRSTSTGKWFLALEIDHLGLIQNLMELPEDWFLNLSEEFLQENVTAQFVGDNKKLERNYQLKFNNLVLEESKRQTLLLNESVNIKAQILLEAQKELQKMLGLFFTQDDFQKIKLWMTHKKIDYNEDHFKKMLQDYTDKHLFKEEQLKLVDFFEHFKNYLFEQMDLTYAGQIHEVFPERLKLSNGREIKLDFSQAPAVYGESLLQDFYGVKSHPTILEGKIKITLRLLGPHKRPIQVTSDIISFWGGSYKQVKKEMQNEYPRHHWADDPLNAPAVLMKKNLVKN